MKVTGVHILESAGSVSLWGTVHYNARIIMTSNNILMKDNLMSLNSYMNKNNNDDECFPNNLEHLVSIHL